MAIVSLFGGSFCHADEVAAGVSRSLDYPIVDDRLFAETSSRFSTSVDSLRAALSGSGSLLGRLTNAREKAIAGLRLVLAELIQPDNLVVTGCAGLLIPRTVRHVLRVCLIANQDVRVQQAMKRESLSERDASKLIHEHDKANFACTEYLFGKAAYDESLYDVVLPVHDSGIGEIIRTVCDHVKSEPVRTTERSVRAAADFVLAARVGLKLAEEGLEADVHAEGGEVIISINKSVVRLNHYREQLTNAALQVAGVTGATTRLGPRYRPTSVNPWSQIEGPPKIMLVDDEKEFVHTLSERLRTRDLESSIAYDGEQALEMAQQETPDVIVLDLMMPGIDGIEVLRRLKRDHPQVEVIILTGHGSDRERQIADELGAFAYLRKPVDIDALARVMRQAYARTGRGGTEPTGGTL